MSAAVFANGRCRVHGGGSMGNPELWYTRLFTKQGIIGVLEWAIDYDGVTDWENFKLTWRSEYTTRGTQLFDIRQAMGDKVEGAATLEQAKEIMQDSDIEIVVRQATSEDLSEFVIPSWLQSYSRSLVAKLMRADGRYSSGREVYWSAQRKRLETILSTPGVKVMVAAIGETNVGWCCEDRKNRVLHYIYVKDAFRKQGVAKMLAGWIDDARGGLVRLTHLPPPWYSRPGEFTREDGSKGVRNLWQPHVIIDLITAV